MVLPDTRLQKNHASTFGRDRKMLFKIQTGKFSRNEMRWKWKGIVDNSNEGLIVSSGYHVIRETSTH